MVDGDEMIRWYLILQCKVLIELLANMHHHNNHNNPMNPKNHSSDNFHAQALLIAYYYHQYPIVLETENGLQYRS